MSDFYQHRFHTMVHSLRRFFYLCLLFAACLLSANAACAQSWQSALALPTSADGSSAINSLVADGAGGYLLAGQFTGTLTLGNATLTSAGGQDAFVAHLSTTGSYSQALRVGGSGDDTATELAVDATGLITVAGTFASPRIVFGTITLTNLDPNVAPGSDIFVARLSAAGTWTQAAQGGSTADDSVSGVALDPNGSAVIVGAYMSNTAKFGTYTLSGSLTGGTTFVARLGSNGAWSQAIRIESSGAPTLISDVAVDASGSAVIAGVCLEGGTLTFGNYTLSTRGAGNCLFVARLNRSGTWGLAVQTTGPNGTTIARHLALDAAGNAVVAGETTAPTATFGNYMVSSPTNPAGSNDFVSFVARLSATGTWTQVAQTTNNSGNCYTSALTLDASGNVWLTGQFNSPTVGFGSFGLTNSDPDAIRNNNFDLYLARLSSAGTWTFATAATGAAARAIVLSNGLVIVAGSFFLAATFGPATISSPAQRAGFLANLGGGILATKASGVAPSACIAWPNPASSYTTISLEADAAPRLVQLLDVLGREVYRKELPAHATSLTMSVAGLPSGYYVLHCGASTGRLVVD